MKQMKITTPPSLAGLKPHTHLPLTELTEALSRFVSENFKGLIRISSRCVEEDRIEVSPEYIVYFLLLLIKATRAESFFEVCADTSGGELTVFHNSSSTLRIDEEYAASLEAFAKEAGFKIEITEKSVVLSKRLESADKVISSIYVASARTIYNDMSVALREINL